MPAASYKFRYFQTRLQHTLQHTQQSTRLIYLVNGGILAAFYFLTGSNSNWSNKTHVGVYLLSVLSFTNFTHAGIMYVQAKWYRLLDEGFADAADLKRPQVIITFFGRENRFTGTLIGTHRLYTALHLFLGIALAAGAIYLWQHPEMLNTNIKFPSLPEISEHVL